MLQAAGCRLKSTLRTGRLHLNRNNTSLFQPRWRVLMLCATMKNEANVSQQPTGEIGLSSHTPTMYSHSSNVTKKRGRGEHEGPSQPLFVHMPIRTEQEAPLPPSAIPKKVRANTYYAPRAVKPSILTAMGSLVGGSQGDSNSSVSVPVRRRLSGGHLEEYLGGHDNMETDNTADSRPRSMSFWLVIKWFVYYDRFEELIEEIG
jgi:hypothetical protein